MYIMIYARYSGTRSYHFVLLLKILQTTEHLNKIGESEKEKNIRLCLQIMCYLIFVLLSKLQNILCLFKKSFVVQIKYVLTI